MAEDLLGGVLGGEDEQPETEASQAAAGAEAFAAAVAARLSGNDPGVARETEAFLREQTLLLKTQRHHLEDEHALRLTQLRGQRVAQVLRIGFQAAVALLVIVIGVGIAVMLRDAYKSHSVVIDTFDSPAALSAHGVTGTVLASGILDELTRLQNATATGTTGQQVKRNLSNGWSDEVKVAVPEAGISLGEISRLLTARFGHDIHLGGDLVQTDSGGLVLTVRGDHVAPRTFTGGAGDLDTLITNAAQFLYSQFQPTLWADYLRQTGRCPEAIDFIRSVYSGAEAGSRASLLDSWGTCADSDQESIRLHQAALRIQPDDWWAYNSMVADLASDGDEEGAWREGQVLLKAAGGNPGKAPAGAFASYDIVTSDYQAVIDSMAANVQANLGSGAASGLNSALQIAQYQAQQHDPAAAELTLETARVDPHSSGSALLQLHFSRGFLAAETGDLAQAVSELTAVIAASPNGVLTAGFANYGACQLAVAADATGHAAEADAVIASGSHVPNCQSFRGDILVHRGDWAGAQQAYAQAVAIATDLPQGYYYWGVALARHGDLTGAVTQLQAANQRGPHWADPLKAWGDVLVKQGHPDQALSKYDEALKYAPNWAALKQAREAAGNSHHG